MVESFLKPGTAAKIQQLKERGFATAKQLGVVLSISFWRDTDNNADGISIPPQEVLVIVAGADGRFGAGSSYESNAERVTTATGELRKEPPFDVRVGDRFVLPPTHPDLAGVSCYVSDAPVFVNPYVRALFKAEF